MRFGRSRGFKQEVVCVGVIDDIEVGDEDNVSVKTGLEIEINDDKDACVDKETDEDASESSFEM